jgi:DNA modification methylase|tara:strand:+ start:413 stop:1096 length:684 start_codon:yes stop_codon:yes gene_type:complete
MVGRVERIGDATLYLGDCLEIMATLDPVDAVVTDPPYGMGFQSNHRKIRHAKIANDETPDALSWVCSVNARHSKYIFCRWDNLADIESPKSLIVWVKNNWSMGDLDHEHARQTEKILFYPGPEHYFPVPRPTDCIYAPRSGNELHPTEKPLQLMRPVVKWTAGTVFDPFMGSGTTGVACAKLGRKFIGIEIDEKYFDIACERIQKACDQPDLFIESPKKAVQEVMEW